MEVPIEARRALPRDGAALDVHHRRRGLVPAPPALLGQPVGEVEVLHVHPVALVEAAGRLEGRAPHQHESAVDGVHGAGANLGRAVGGEPPGGAAAAAQAAEVPESAQGGREGALARVIEGSVGPLQPRADHRHLGVRLEHRHNGVERSRGHGGIRVEREQVGGPAPPRPQVGAGGEPQVLCGGDQFDLRILACDQLTGAVAGVVVDDHHRHRTGRRVSSERVEALPNHLAGAIGDDHDVEFAAVAHGNEWLRSLPDGMLTSRGSTRLGRLRPAVRSETARRRSSA